MRPDHDHIQGHDVASLTLVEYADFECPFCAETTGLTRQLPERFRLLFDRQDRLGFEHLMGYAVEVGLDVERFARDLDADRVRARVRSDVASAEASGARGPPTFLANSRRHVGPQDVATRRRTHGHTKCPRRGRRHRGPLMGTRRGYRA